MIALLERVSHYVYEAIIHYQKAEESLKSLNHDSVYDQCKIALGATAIATYIIANETEPQITEAINWVDGLPIPNGLYSSLIEAVHVVERKYFPLLGFALSYPTSRKNLDLIFDALEELLQNIHTNDENKEFDDILREWINTLGYDYSDIIG
ncbi:MAG: hypothetical protein FK733_03330 [Asgard group archaeon]|nr:hypothetical protein [Asgard group archaeon]